MMLKYVKTCQNNRPYLDTSRLSSPIQNIRRVRLYTKRLNGRMARRFVSILVYLLLWRIPIVKWNSLEHVVFEFDRKSGPGGKLLFLRTFCFYFRLAGFTYLSPLPEVDKSEEIGRNRGLVKIYTLSQVHPYNPSSTPHPLPRFPLYICSF